MKLEDREKVDAITIGRRVVTRVVQGQRKICTYRSYTAVYKDREGKWQAEGLGTSNKTAARRRAIEIQQRLEAGTAKRPTGRPTLREIVDLYEAFVASKGLAPKSLAKYRSELQKIREFATEAGIQHADRFDEHAFYRFRAWLEGRKHKQGRTYSAKSIYSAGTICKQVFKWAWRSRLLSEYSLASASLPKARAKPQPCFTTEQVEKLRASTTGNLHDAITILAYSGMRVGELQQLQWMDVLLDRGELGVFHIRRGGSRGTTKDKEDRFVPVHPLIRPVLERRSRGAAVVIPDLEQKWLLNEVKKACASLGFGRAFKVHSFRHFFASMCANNNVAYKKALAWLGHSGSNILDLYYHLSDEDAQKAMIALFKGT